MSDKTIFFSYSRDDSEFVLNLANNLREAGANVWLDQLDIKAGSRWDKSIEDALDEANTLLVILSKTSVESTNVLDEVSFALDESKTVVPVLMEECNIPFRLRRLQFADFTTDFQRGIDTLIEALQLESKVASKLNEVATPKDSEPEKKAEITKEEKVDTNEKPKVETTEKAKVDTTQELKPENTKSSEVKPTAVQEKKSKSKAPAIIIVVVAVLAIAGYFLKDTIFPDKDQAFWNITLENNQKSDYESYLKLYPKGKFAVYARDSINSKTIQENTKAELDAWNTAAAIDKKESYQEYLDEYSEGLHAKEAREKINDFNAQENIITQDSEAWEKAKINGGSFTTFLAYYLNKDIAQRQHLSEAVAKLKELGNKGWLYSARSDGTKVTGDRLFEIKYRLKSSSLADDTFPKEGDIVKPLFSESSRRIYTLANPRNSVSGNWGKNELAYVLSVKMENTALILQIVHPK